MTKRKTTTERTAAQDFSGRTLGVTEVLSRIPGRNAAGEARIQGKYHCRCSMCGSDFVANAWSVESGAVAKHGCGCKKMRKGGEMPRFLPKVIVPFPREGSGTR